VSPVKYELGFYIPEDDILHSHRRENIRFALVVGQCNTLTDITRNHQGTQTLRYRASHALVDVRCVQELYHELCCYCKGFYEYIST
jgi:hypothetical protein